MSGEPTQLRHASAVIPRSDVSLIVGVGTTGWKSALKAKALMVADPAILRAASVEVLVTDTKENSSTDFAPEVRPRPDQMFVTGPVDVQAVQKNPEKYADLLRMGRFDRIKVATSASEALQVPVIGLLGVWRHWHTATSQIRSAIARLAHISKMASERDDLQQRLNVYFVCHGAGGTGASQVPALAAIAREAAGTMPITVNVCLIVPEARVGQGDMRALANFVARLKEYDLAWARAAKSREIPMFTPNGPRKFQTLVDRVFLLGMQNQLGVTHGTQDATEDTLARFLHDIVTPGLAERLRSSLAQTESAMGQTADERLPDGTLETHPSVLAAPGRYTYDTGQKKVAAICSLREAIRAIEVVYLRPTTDQSVRQLRVGAGEHDLDIARLTRAADLARPQALRLPPSETFTRDALPAIVDRMTRQYEADARARLAEVGPAIQSQGQRILQKVSEALRSYLASTPGGTMTALTAVAQLRQLAAERAHEATSGGKLVSARCAEAQRTLQRALEDVLRANARRVFRMRRVSSRLEDMAAACEARAVAEHEREALHASNRALVELAEGLRQLESSLRNTATQLDSMMKALVAESHAVLHRPTAPTEWNHATDEDVAHFYALYRHKDDEALAASVLKRLAPSPEGIADVSEFRAQLVNFCTEGFAGILEIPFEQWIERKLKGRGDIRSFIKGIMERAAPIPIHQEIIGSGVTLHHVTVIHLPQGAERLAQHLPAGEKIFHSQGDDRHSLRVVRVTWGFPKFALEGWPTMRAEYVRMVDDPSEQPIHVMEHLLVPPEDRLRVLSAAIALEYVRSAGAGGQHWFLWTEHGRRGERVGDSWDNAKTTICENDTLCDILVQRIHAFRDENGDVELARRLLTFDPDTVPKKAQEDIIENIDAFVKDELGDALAHLGEEAGKGSEAPGGARAAPKRRSKRGKPASTPQPGVLKSDSPDEG